MIKIISHRGCIEGKSKYENTIGLIYTTLEKGFDVEIDIRYADSDQYFFLGHDFAIKNQTIDIKSLEDSRLIVHCKDQKSYDVLSKNPLVNCFYQDTENWVRTSQNDIVIHGDISVGDFVTHYRPKLIIGNYKSNIYAWFVNKKFEDYMKDFLLESSYCILTDYPMSYKEGLK